jgi:hypothetical protein
MVFQKKAKVAQTAAQTRVSSCSGIHAFVWGSDEAKVEERSPPELIHFQDTSYRDQLLSGGK